MSKKFTFLSKYVFKIRVNDEANKKTENEKRKTENEKGKTENVFSVFPFSNFTSLLSNDPCPNLVTKSSITRESLMCLLKPTIRIFTMKVINFR